MARQGDSWTVSSAAAEKLLRHGYPPLPYWDARLAKVRTGDLTATVQSVTGGETRVRLEGKLDLVYPDKGGPTDGRQTARLIGLRGATPARGHSLPQLVSEEGRYVWYWQETRQPPRPTSIAIELEP